MTSAGVSAASAAGVGQRAIHSRQTGSTRATGVCWSITSETSTAQASTPGRRHGRSRAAVAYQSTIAFPVAEEADVAVPTTVQCAVPRAAACRTGLPRRGRYPPGVLHPVGPLPAAVYWRRRLLVLTLLLSVLGGGGWVGYAAATGRFDDGTTTVAATTPATSPAPPALERVVPSPAGLRIPTAPSSTAATPSVPLAPPATAVPCTDDMIALEVRTPGSAPVGAGATFQLVATNTAPVACVRSLDTGLQELVLLDAQGNRLWGSDDCVRETSSDLRALAPGEAVSLPVEWSGLTSEPTCSAPRAPLAPGAYVVRGRLDTKVSGDAPFALSQL